MFTEKKSFLKDQADLGGTGRKFSILSGHQKLGQSVRSYNVVFSNSNYEKDSQIAKISMNNIRNMFVYYYYISIEN